MSPDATNLEGAETKWVTKRTWEEFRSTGLLWWINQILHVFGWAIVVVVEGETQEVKDAWPARVKYRGFGREAQDEGFQKVSRYIRDMGEKLLEEAQL